MDNVGLVTAVRYDQLLLLSKENAPFGAPSQRPCPLYLHSFHRDRILAAACAAKRSYPQLEGDAGLELMANKIGQHVAEQGTDDSQALKVRLVVSPTGSIDVCSLPVPQVPQTLLFPKSLEAVFKAKPTYRIYLSPAPCTPSFHTRFKTTNRSQYDKARSMIPRTNGDELLSEILLVNEKGDVMEGSFTTPYFNHNTAWVTPAEDSGGNLGVTRRWSLARGLCEESLVSMGSIHVGSLGEKVVLSNSVRGFGWGRIEPLTT